MYNLIPKSCNLVVLVPISVCLCNLVAIRDNIISLSFNQLVSVRYNGNANVDRHVCIFVVV